MTESSGTNEASRDADTWAWPLVTHQPKWSRSGAEPDHFSWDVAAPVRKAGAVRQAPAAVVALGLALVLALTGAAPATAVDAAPRPAPAAATVTADPAEEDPEETPGDGDSDDEKPDDEPDDEGKPDDEKPKEEPKPKPPPAPQGRVVGRVVDGTGQGVGRAPVAVFDASWTWLREVKARRTGGFSISLPPGTYRLQASDSRPAWDTSRRAPADATVTVRAHRDATRTLRLRRGAHVTGSVTRSMHNAPAARAKVRATDEVGRTFEVNADGGGRFALGGLPPGNYRLWGYDKGRQWVGRTVKVGWLGRGDGRHLMVRMRTRAGAVNGYVMEGPRIARSTTWVTAISRRTGQWWVVRARGGDLSLRGLAPGRYTFVVTSTREWQGRTLRPRTKVRPGRTQQVVLRLDRRA